MRTKALLGLAALAAMITSAAAQNVYSVNVVGYVNVTLQANRLHFLSIPLAPVDGNWNIQNTINPGDSQMGAQIYKWNVDQQKWDDENPLWLGDWGGSAMQITNGVGFFLASVADSVMTFVGEVPQSTTAPLQYNISGGALPLSTLANKVPVSTNFPGTDVTANFGDIMYVWNAGAGSAGAWNDTTYLYLGDWGAGTEGGPLLNPTEAAFYVSNGDPISFSKNFTVAP